MSNNRAKKRLLAQFLKETIETSGISQRDLADKMGYFQNTIHRILAGKKNIGALELVDLCKICNISWIDILSRIENSPDTTK